MGHDLCNDIHWMWGFTVYTSHDTTTHMQCKCACPVVKSLSKYIFCRLNSELDGKYSLIGCMMLACFTVYTSHDTTTHMQCKCACPVVTSLSKYIFCRLNSELDGKYSLIDCMMFACAHAWLMVAVFWLHLAQCGMLMALGMPCMWAILIGQKVVTSSWI